MENFQGLFLNSLISSRTIIWWIIIIIATPLLFLGKGKKNENKLDKRVNILNYATLLIAIFMIFYEVFLR